MTSWIMTFSFRPPIRNQNFEQAVSSKAAFRKDYYPTEDRVGDVYTELSALLVVMKFHDGKQEENSVHEAILPRTILHYYLLHCHDLANIVLFDIFLNIQLFSRESQSKLDYPIISIYSTFPTSPHNSLVLIVQLFLANLCSMAHVFSQGW